jgi:hypothetical protein
MVSNYVYRGSSFKKLQGQEFSTGEIEGHTASIFRGRLDTETPHATVPRGTPVEDLPWWVPEGIEDKGYVVEEKGVTGGLTRTLGTAINFGPVVLFLNQRDMRHTPVQVSYNYGFFDGYEGALSWVKGGNVGGEIHTEEEGLIGLVTETETGWTVTDWGKNQMEVLSMRHTDERELLAAQDSISVDRSLESVGMYLQSRRSVTRMLADQPGYHSGTRRGDGIDASAMDESEAARRLHELIQGRANRHLPDFWLVVLNSKMMEHFHEVPEGTFEYATDGTSIVADRARVPGHLLNG